MCVYICNDKLQSDYVTFAAVYNNFRGNSLQRFKARAPPSRAETRDINVFSAPSILRRRVSARGDRIL